mmetsp:Transcript_35172/g.88648  ORF Transcript_35172/g.88648 Transcript_35172/m.88648 type:complete len:253 (-) Transcript_35172:300-1058(-)
MKASAGFRPGSKRSLSLKSWSTEGPLASAAAPAAALVSANWLGPATAGASIGVERLGFVWRRSLALRCPSSSLSSPPTAKAPLSRACLSCFCFSERCLSSSAFLRSSSARTLRSSALASNSKRCRSSSLCSSSRLRRSLSGKSSPLLRTALLSLPGMSLSLPCLRCLACSLLAFLPGAGGCSSTCPAGAPPLGSFFDDEIESQASAARATAAYHPSPRSRACRSTTPVSGATALASGRRPDVEPEVEPEVVA